MRVNFKYFIALFVSCFTLVTYSQNVDSLKLLLKKSKPDTARLRILTGIAEICDMQELLKYAETSVELADKLLKEENSPESRKFILRNKADAYSNIGLSYTTDRDNSKALFYYQKSLKIQEEINNPIGISVVLNNMGLIKYNLGNVNEALELFKRSVKIKEDIGKYAGVAQSYNNIATVYSMQGNINMSLDYFSKSLKISEKLKDSAGIATTLLNIGVLYTNQNEHKTALDYFNRSLKIQQLIGNKRGIANSLNCIGSINELSDINKAFDNYMQALKINEELNNRHGMAQSYNNVGLIYLRNKNLDSAYSNFARSLKFQKEIQDVSGASTSFLNIGSVYLQKKMYNLSRTYYDTALFYSKKLGFPDKISSVEHHLSVVDSATGNFAGAFEHYKQYIKYNDSLVNTETRKAGIKNQLKYEYEKKEAIIKEQQEKERVIAEEKDRFQKIIIGSVIFGLLLVIVFAAFVFRSLRVTRQQKILIEEKQKEILDSIHYAKRIQKSLLPTEKYISSILNSKNKK